MTGVYLDGPLGLVLTHAGAPVATASFLFEDLWTLTVLQLEPVHEVRWDPANPSRDLADPAALAACERRAAEVLAGFDWQKGMIEVLERYARGWGFVTLALQTGRKRAEGWGPAGAVRGHETLAGGTASYDKLAERLGFYQRANGDWCPDVQEARVTLPSAAPWTAPVRPGEVGGVRTPSITIWRRSWTSSLNRKLGPLPGSVVRM